MIARGETTLADFLRMFQWPKRRHLGHTNRREERTEEGRGHRKGERHDDCWRAHNQVRNSRRHTFNFFIHTIPLNTSIHVNSITFQYWPPHKFTLGKPKNKQYLWKMPENQHYYLFQHSENFDSLLTVQESEDAVTMLAPGPPVAAAATFMLVIGPALSLIVRYVIIINYFF